MLRGLLSSACFLLAACSGGEPAAQTGGPVRQGVANADFAPAFAGQTRAPEAVSGVALAIEEIARLEHPWAIVLLPDGRALVTERPGRLRVVARDGLVSAPIAGLPSIQAEGQGGLLDVVLSPDFATDRQIFFSYSAPAERGESTTRVARARLSEDLARLDNAQVIFGQAPAWRSDGHFGSRLVFDREGRLFVTLGDRQQGSSRRLAQDLSTHIGKVVRIGVDGAAAPNNPFLAQADVRPEIWSFGHRNVQGADLHPETGELWTIEHGPRGGDELNVTRAGLNYGWPIISYGEEYSGARVGEGIAVREGLEQPLYYWDPVIAPGDMDFYRGELFPWRGDLLIGGLAVRALVRLELEGERVIGEERFDIGARVRDMAEASDGALWLITDEGDGRVLRLTPGA